MNNEIVAQYKHSKSGTFMFNFCAKWSVRLYKTKWLYWLIQFTWGLPMIFIGLLVSLVFLCLGKKPIKTPFGWRFETGKGWGGSDLGIVYIRDEKLTDELDGLDAHEMGHCLTQNIILGPLFPFVVAIPSAIRYWYHVIITQQYARAIPGSPKYDKWKAKSEGLPPYDEAWFEDLASVGGEYFLKNI